MDRSVFTYLTELVKLNVIPMKIKRKGSLNKVKFYLSTRVEETKNRLSDRKIIQISKHRSQQGPE